MEILCFATRCSITSIIALAMCHIVPIVQQPREMIMAMFV